MTSNEIVLHVIAALDQHAIPYMLVGSYSSNAYGVARSTQDADFVIEIGDRPINPLFESLAPILQFDPQMRLETVTMTLRYVGRHADSGFKVELFLTSDDPHDRERFRRRTPYPFLGTTAYLPTPEDVIIQKLRWFQRSRRIKDFDDVKNVIDTQSPNLDLDYVRRWSDQHGSRETLEKILSGATAP